jgi:subtilisin family serine protease
MYKRMRSSAPRLRFLPAFWLPAFWLPAFWLPAFWLPAFWPSALWPSALWLAALWSLGATGCGPEAELPRARRVLENVPTARLDPALFASLDRGETPEALVLFDTEPVSEARAHVEAACVSRLANRGDLLFEGTRLPAVAVRLRSAEDLLQLVAEPRAVRIEAVRWLARTDIPSLVQIGQPAAAARGAVGEGATVAVVDTGADASAPELGACEVGPGCGVLAAVDLAPEDGMADDEVRHGTNVASIVRLVAPGARIAALDVFTGDLASSVDIAAAVDWILAHQREHRIVAANFSLGAGLFSAPCPDDGLARLVQRLRDAGVAPIVSAGNDGASGAMSAPGCSPAAISVGAVDADDSLAPFSNVSSLTTLVAPGVGIHAGGVWMSGTSQAAPHVSGAWAVLARQRPGDTLDALEDRLVTRSRLVHDDRSGLDLHRLDLDRATEPDPAPPGDTLPPVGALQLGSGAPTTPSRVIPVHIRAFDLSGLDAMCLSTGQTCTAWRTFSTSASVTAPRAGFVVVRLWLRDRAGNVTPTPYTSTVAVLR